MVIGTDAKMENRLTGIEKRIINGTMPDSAGILVSEGLAADLRISTGDTVVVFGQGYEGSIAAGKYVVSGTVHFASPGLNSGLVYLSLPTAQELFSAYGRLTSAVVILKDDKDLETIRDRVAAGIGSEYETVTWKKILPDIENHIQADTVFFFIEIGVLYIVIAFGIFGTLIMMMNERRRENSMLLAVGMKNIRMGWILFVETVLLGGIGAITGIILSYPVVSYLTLNPIRFSGRTAAVFEQFGFEPIFPATVDPIIFLQQGIIIFGLSVLLGFYPFISALRMNPLTSLRNA
jgi:ABC-type lipoprotein release transport system permease subunit